MSDANGSVLWQGKSRIDGSPIVAILTYQSANRGTGDMSQVWILRSDMLPTEAIRDNLDVAICGNCPLRGDHGKGSACYVNPAHGPNPIYRAFRNGRYPIATPSDLSYNLRMRKVRLGAYGDPCAVPLRVWSKLLRFAPKGHTGYTHQWEDSRNQPYRRILMASVESVSGAREALSRGWRYFRLHAPGVPLIPGEIECPKSTAFPEVKRLDCAHCGACNGSRRTGQASIAIEIHGSRPKRSNALRTLASV